jgi:hypothetical protein
VIQWRFHRLARWAVWVWAAWLLPAAGAAPAQPPRPDLAPPTAYWTNPIASSNRLATRPTANAAVPVPRATPTNLPPPRPLTVNWVAPARRPNPPTNPLPAPNRPLMTCAETPRSAVKSDAPTLPPPRPAPITMTPANPPPPRPLGCRFAEARPARRDDAVIYAAVRGAWGAPADGTSAEALRQAVDTVCRAAGAEVRAAVVGDRQVKVELTVRSRNDWQLLYARLQGLPELGDQAMLFRVSVRP